MDIKSKLDLAVASALEELSTDLVESIRNPLQEKDSSSLMKDLEGFVTDLGFKKDESGRFEKKGKDDLTLNLEFGENTDGKLIVNSIAAHVSEEMESSVESDSFTKQDVDNTNFQRLKVGLASFVKKWEAPES